MVHMDVKKVGRIPTGGGWRVHGRGTDAARASRRGGRKAAYTYLHSMIDGFSRLVTDNGSAYRSTAFNDAVCDLVGRHQYTRPYTPRHNGKVERYNRILAEELLYAVHSPARSSEETRWANGPPTTITTDPTPPRRATTRQPRPHPHKQCHTLIQLAQPRLQPRTDHSPAPRAQRPMTTHTQPLSTRKPAHTL